MSESIAASSNSGQSSRDSSRSRSATGSKDSEVNSNLKSSSDENEDLLSDVYDSDSNASDNEEELTFNHKYVTIKSTNGVKKIDITEPDYLLQEAIYKRKKLYNEKKEECVRTSVKTLALTRILYGEDENPNLKLANCHFWIARAYWEIKEYAMQTDEHTDEALKYLSIFESLSPIYSEITEKPSSIDLMPDLYEFFETSVGTNYLKGRAQMALKKYDKAERHFNTSLRHLERAKNLEAVKHVNFWKCENYTGLSRNACALKRYEAGINFMKNVSTIIEKKYGSESNQLKDVYTEMSKMYCKKSDRTKDKKEAINFAEQAYAIATEKQNPEIVGDMAVRLAQTHTRMNSEDGNIYAETFLNEAITAYENSVGRASKKSILACNLMVEFLASHGRLTEATNLQEAEIVNFDLVYGSFSPHIARAIQALGKLHLKSGNCTKAAKELKKSIKVQEFVYGKNHPKTHATTKALKVLLQ